MTSVNQFNHWRRSGRKTEPDSKTGRQSRGTSSYHQPPIGARDPLAGLEDREAAALFTPDLEED